MSKAPVIPNLKCLRRVGQGAYGEVWLCRTLTNSFIALKMIRRSFFKTTQQFEREFKAIQLYERISHRHPSLIDILHVGKSKEFYYYTMKLADSEHSGWEKDPGTYRPLTLAENVGRSRHGRIVRCSAEYILPLLDALSVLHDSGLVHRDIKPSNVLIINNEPVLADIGLVASASTDISHVGTPGFIPPEGPGKPQADIYAIGKLLYVMISGKSAACFPDLPTLIDGEDRLFYRELNKFLIKACNRKPSARYASAASMRQALVRLLDANSIKSISTSAKSKNKLHLSSHHVKTMSKRVVKSQFNDVLRNSVRAIQDADSAKRQIFTPVDVRNVAGPVRSTIASLLGYIPDEMTAFIMFAQAAVELNSKKRFSVIQKAYDVYDRIAGREEPPGILENMLMRGPITRFLEAINLPAIDHKPIVLVRHQGAQWLANYLGKLQVQPKFARGSALSYLKEGIEMTVDRHWPPKTP